MIDDSNLNILNQTRFNKLYSLLRDFFINRILINNNYCQSIAKHLYDVLDKCNEEIFEEPGVVEAYVLMHFLDRYHRFQIICDKLHCNKIMPIKPRKVNILDVGTGPGHAIYAISDFYSDLDPSEINIPIPENNQDRIKIDYIEKCSNFRNWLHDFTEYANYASKNNQFWNVPYHLGTFFNFQDVEFNKRRTFKDYDSNDDELTITYTEKFRFDLIIFSNFFTLKTQISKYRKEIINCARYLRNNGILIIVGAKSSNNNYDDIYQEISNVIQSEKYSNWKFIANCHKINIDNPIMGYSMNDPYGTVIKKFYKKCYGILKEKNSLNNFDPRAINGIEKAIKPKHDRRNEWEIHVFRKKAKIRNKKYLIKKHTYQIH